VFTTVFSTTGAHLTVTGRTERPLNRRQEMLSKLPTPLLRVAANIIGALCCSTVWLSIAVAILTR
jgi:hypothetical protein